MEISINIIFFLFNTNPKIPIKKSIKVIFTIYIYLLYKLFDENFFIKYIYIKYGMYEIQTHNISIRTTRFNLLNMPFFYIHLFINKIMEELNLLLKICNQSVNRLLHNLLTIINAILKLNLTKKIKEKIIF